MSERARVEQASGFLAGLAIGLSAYAALLSNPRIEAWLEHDVPIPPVPGAALTAVLTVVVIGYALVRRHRLVAVVVALNVPMFVAGTIVRIAEPNPSWARPLRNVGLALAIGMALVASLVYARRKRELERAVFHEGTMFAFFITVTVVAIYGVLQVTFDVPEISILWVPIFAGVAWIVSLNVAERRYS